MKKRSYNPMRFFKAITVVWLMTAVFTQGFAAGLSCVHHFNLTTNTQDHAVANIDDPQRFTQHWNPEHTTHQMPPNQLSKHYHHSLLKAEPLDSVHSYHNISKTHCDTQTGVQMQHNDCKCTHFISVELLEVPTLTLQQARSFCALPALEESFLSADLTSIYRPPLNA